MARQHTYDVEQLKARVETAKEALDSQLNALLHTEAWTQPLKSMAVLGCTSIARFSFRNLMLLVSQRPEIHHAATFQAWRALGRSVRKGEKALNILKPRFAKRAAATQAADAADKHLVGFSILPLFALEQTDGGAPLEPAVVPRDFENPTRSPTPSSSYGTRRWLPARTSGPSRCAPVATMTRPGLTGGSTAPRGPSSS